MTMDWNVVATIASPVLAMFVGIGLERLFSSRAKLVSYLGHVSGISLHRGDQPITVNSHSIVLRNNGRTAAKNVRVGHAHLPDFQIYPDTDYQVVPLPGGNREIRIPQLIPGKQLTITYLYFPPLTWQQVNTHTESDEGSAKIVNVLPTAQLPTWAIRILWFFIAYGLIGVFYTLYALFASLGSA